MRCDTCHREVPEVSRVVIYRGYNRIASKAVYNCPECFAKKERTKRYYQEEEKERTQHDKKAQGEGSGV